MHCARWLTGSLAVLLSIAGCGGSDGESAAVAEVDSASHSWRNYHWARTANPFTLHLGDNVSGPWDSSLSTASGDWSKSTVLDTQIVAGRSTRNCKPTSGRVEVCNARYGYNGWLGVAGVWVSGGHIVQGYVKLNDSYFSSPTYNTTPWRNLVMCQEIGHTLGLDHQDEDFDDANLGTCMDYTNDPSTNQHPNQHDYEMLVQIYQHTDDTTTLEGTTGFVAGRLPPQANDNADPDDVGPPAWGALIRRSRDGRLEVWELDLGAGNKVIRFVRRP